MQTQEGRRDPVGFREGTVAGLALALADALATGVQRTPPRLLLLILAFGLVVGLGAGLAQTVVRRRGTALALVVAFGTVLNGLSLASKDLAGDRITGLFVLLAALLGAVACLTLRPERRGPALVFVILAGVPGSSLLVATLGASALTVGLTSYLPLALALLVRTHVVAGSHLVRGAAVVATAVLLVLPVARRDPDTTREDQPQTSAARAQASAPDVVLAIVDTLRADALPADGTFARLAENGVRFTDCVSTAPWTLPSVSSILTSLLPSQHGATSAARPLPADVVTLAEAFAAAGYQTAGFTGGAFVSSAFRLDQGFEHFDATAEFGFRPLTVHVPLVWRLAKNRYVPLRSIAGWVGEYPGIEGLCSAAERWLETRDRERPLFLLLHTYEAHDYYLYHPGVDEDVPGDPSARFRGRLSVHPSELSDANASDVAWFRTIYERRIDHVEETLGELLASLESKAGRSRVIALTSDHGEGFDATRRRVHHGGRLHDDLLRVPLILAAPDRLPVGTRVDAQVSTVDLMPTLLDLAGVPAPEGLAGGSLVRLARGELGDQHDAWSEERSNGRNLLSLRTEGWKLVRDDEEESAFELARDPLEDAPTSGPAALRERIRAFSELYPARQVDEADIDPATLEHLRKLGYVD